MFCLNHRSIKVTLFSEIHIKIISKISLTYHQIAFFQIKNVPDPTAAGSGTIILVVPPFFDKKHTNLPCQFLVFTPNSL